MKKYQLLIIALLLSSASFAQGFFTYINKSNQFFDTLDSGKYDKAQAFFDESVQNKVTPEALETIWKQLKAQLGELEAVEGAQSKVQDEYQIVILNCKFKNGTQPFQFVYNDKEKLIGFFVAPKNSAASYKLPAYADSTQYTEKLITIQSGTHELPGMLTLPKTGSGFPIVVLIHGSGPADMDESVGMQKPFKDIAIGLANKGIATIRYVKRTTLYPAEFAEAFTLKEEVIEDAIAALNFAKKQPEIDPEQIFLLGHSLGGMVAPQIATLNPEIKGIILAAAPARKLTDIMAEQNNYMSGIYKDTSAVAKNMLTKTLKDLKMAATLKNGVLPADSMILGLPVSYWADINSLEQTAIAKKLKTNIFVLQGGNDFQVSEVDFNLWKAALKNKKNASLKLYPMLNHLFSFVNEKGTINQYQQPGNVDEVVIHDIADWIIPTP